MRGDNRERKERSHAMKRMSSQQFYFSFYYGVHCVGISLRSDV